MLRWLRRIRGEAEPTLKLFSPERFAEELEMCFRSRVEWWGG